MQTFQIEALGTHWSINYDGSGDLTEEITQLIATFETNYSRFRENSLISQLNTQKSLIASDELLDIITIGKQAFEMSGGVFSPFVGTLLEHSGYDAQYSFTKKGTPPIYEMDLSIDGSIITLGKHTSIDIGGWGKGYLIDKIAKYFQKKSIQNWIIDGGGDIRFTRSDPKYIQSIGIAHPQDKTILIAERTRYSGAIATSSSLKRRRRKNHHLINPQTGRSTTNSLLSVSVFADSACLADIGATTLFVGGKEEINPLSQRFNVDYLALGESNSLVYSGGIDGLEVFD